MKNLVRIGAFARLIDCDAQTIRRLDRCGLFAPRRDRAGHRRYDPKEDAETVRALRATIKPGRRPKDPAAPRRRKLAVALGRGGVGAVPAPHLAGPACEGEKLGE